MQRAGTALTQREILDVAVKVGEFIKEEAGRMDKQVSGKDISAIAGVIDFLSYDE